MNLEPLRRPLEELMALEFNVLWAAAKKVVRARKQGSSWDDLKTAIGELEDIVGPGE